jgi:hypothetical protein
LSGLSITSDDSSGTAISAASGSTTTAMPRSTLKRGFGSAACSNLRALSVQMEGDSRDASSAPMQVDTTGDDWGYFVDSTVSTSQSSCGGVQISW